MKRVYEWVNKKEDESDREDGRTDKKKLLIVDAIVLDHLLGLAVERLLEIVCALAYALRNQVEL